MALSAPQSIYDISVTNIDNESFALKKYQGQVMMIVNTASKCGFTPQYEGLEKMYEKYKDRGLVVLGFPSNDFGEQEPGSADEIKKFCRANYGVTFPLFKKDSVSGEKAQPLYKYLTEQTADSLKGKIRWNFTKFLVNRKGEVIERYGPTVSPSSPSIVRKIEKALAEK